jgi:Protein of unknown function DUF262
MLAILEVMMSLESEIAKSAKEIFTDGYDMSIGEVVSLYKEGELVINPEYQRLFRWESHKKSRFIESLLLGIPIPPIFVFQNIDGTWELVDGLQRTSTLLEFMGLLVSADGSLVEGSTLEGTKLLPSLEGKTWDGSNSIGKSLQISIRRSRLRVEILKKESDQQSKYELFQRLNTGGSVLSEQEIRNSVMLMIKRDFYYDLKQLADDKDFKESISLTKAALDEQRHMELVLRIFSYVYNPYEGKLDVNEYLDESMIYVMNAEGNFEPFNNNFKFLFQLLNSCMGKNTFKKHTEGHASGAFSIAAFESITYGLMHNIESYKLLPKDEACALVEGKVKDLWNNPTFTSNSGAGVRGTTRLINLLPHAREYFAV